MRWAAWEEVLECRWGEGMGEGEGSKTLFVTFAELFYLTLFKLKPAGFATLVVECAAKTILMIQSAKSLAGNEFQ